MNTQFCDAEVAERLNNPADYSDFERGQDIEDKAWDLMQDDEAMTDAINDLFIGIVTNEERRLTAAVKRQIPNSRMLQDSRAREAIRIIRALPDDNRLKQLVMAEIRFRAETLVDRGAA